MDNAPEFHDRFSIHPRSVASCRALLMAMAWSVRDEEEIESLSDWEAIRKVENLRKGVVSLTKSLQGVTRATTAAVARLAPLADALAPVAAEGAAEELELFLAIDHPA